jgi:hypothetical protein
MGTNRQCKWKCFTDAAIQAKNRTKSRIRSRVEHSIGVIKRVFGFTKVHYRGLAKNANRAFLTAALANIFMLRYACWEQCVRSKQTGRNRSLSRRHPPDNRSDRDVRPSLNTHQPKITRLCGRSLSGALGGFIASYGALTQFTRAAY